MKVLFRKRKIELNHFDTTLLVPASNEVLEILITWKIKSDWKRDIENDGFHIRLGTDKPQKFHFDFWILSERSSVIRSSHLNWSVFWVPVPCSIFEEYLHIIFRVCNYRRLNKCYTIDLWSTFESYRICAFEVQVWFGWKAFWKVSNSARGAWSHID